MAQHLLASNGDVEAGALEAYKNLMVYLRNYAVSQS